MGRLFRGDGRRLPLGALALVCIARVVIAQDAFLCENSTDINGVCYCGCECDWRFSWRTEAFDSSLCQSFCRRECGASFDYEACGVFTSCEEIENAREEVFAAAIAGDRHSYCFPETATVLLRSGETRRMSELQVGDEALSNVSEDGRRHFSRILGWGHREPRGVYPFVTIATESGEVLTMSAGHYLPRISPSGGAPSLVTAEAIRPGDQVRRGDGSVARAVLVKSSTSRGLFNPHTASGALVVDNIVVSCYTDALHPRLAHWLLAPIRLLSRAGLHDPLGARLHRTRPEARWLPSGPPVTRAF